VAAGFNPEQKSQEDEFSIDDLRCAFRVAVPGEEKNSSSAGGEHEKTPRETLIKFSDFHRDSS
jgi:hypothetical protein